MGGGKFRREAWSSGFRHSRNRESRGRVIGNFHSESPGINQGHSSLEDAWRQSRLSGEIPTGKPNRHIGIRCFANPEDKATGVFEIVNHEVARSSKDRPSLRMHG